MTKLRITRNKVCHLSARCRRRRGVGGVVRHRVSSGVVGALSAWAGEPRAWGAGGIGACRCGCKWQGSRGTASAAPCASGSGASGWTPPCRRTCSATAPRSRPPPRTCCGTSTAARARALQCNVPPPSREPVHYHPTVNILQCDTLSRRISFLNVVLKNKNFHYY